MNLNQLTIIGFLGKNAETKQLPNGSSITNFSVATNRSWKDEKGKWKARRSGISMIAFGQRYAQMTPRLLKGTLVFVQGELSTREYKRANAVTVRKTAVEHLIHQLAVELKAEIIRVLDPSSNTDPSELTEPAVEDEVSPQGAAKPNWCTAWRILVYVIDITLLQSIRYMVDGMGFEPTTPTLRTWCSPN